MGVASSLREVALRLVDELALEAPALAVAVSFGASSTLARQLELGAPIDLLVSADAELVDRMVAKGVLDGDSAREIARGRLVLVARSDSALLAAGLEALVHPDMKRLGLPGESVPLGGYGRAWLRSQDRIEELRGKIVETGDARANLRALEAGHVDLAILYASDAQRSSDTRVVHSPAEADYPAIRYVAAIAADRSRCPGPLRVLETWQSSATKRSLTEQGFETDS